MKLIKQACGVDCTAASIAMVLGLELDFVKAELFKDLPKPFPSPWDHLPKVPDMNVICDWAWRTRSAALTPFERDPVCTPHRDCPPVSVYPRNTRTSVRTAEGAWRCQLSYGPGLLEGVIIGREVGHMVAWSGDAIYDPRGHIYTSDDAESYFSFQPRRFWLYTPTRK